MGELTFKPWQVEVLQLSEAHIQRLRAIFAPIVASQLEFGDVECDIPWLASVDHLALLRGERLERQDDIINRVSFEMPDANNPFLVRVKMSDQPDVWEALTFVGYTDAMDSWYVLPRFWGGDDIYTAVAMVKLEQPAMMVAKVG